MKKTFMAALCASVLVFSYAAQAQVAGKGAVPSTSQYKSLGGHVTIFPVPAPRNVGLSYGPAGYVCYHPVFIKCSERGGGPVYGQSQSVLRLPYIDTQKALDRAIQLCTEIALLELNKGENRCLQADIQLQMPDYEGALNDLIDMASE